MEHGFGLLPSALLCFLLFVSKEGQFSCFPFYWSSLHRKPPPHEHYRDFDIPDLVLSPESEPGTRKPELHICSKQATCSRRCHPRSALSTISSSVTNLRLSPRVITKLLWPKNPNLKVDFLTWNIIPPDYLFPVKYIILYVGISYWCTSRSSSQLF